MASEGGRTLRNPTKSARPASSTLAPVIIDVSAPPAAPKTVIGSHKTLKRKHSSLRGSEVRHVRTKGARIYTGMHPVSRLDGKMLSGEASIEQDFWTIVDIAFEDLVEAYAQPLTTKITIRDRTSTWTPDALLVRAGRRDTLVECKPLIELQPDPAEMPVEAQLALERYDAWVLAADKLGMDLLVMSEDDVRLEPRFHNAQVMHRAEGNQVPGSVIDRLVPYLCDWPVSCTVAHLIPVLGQFANSALLVACTLDRLGYVRLDRKNYFTPEVAMINRMSRSFVGEVSID